MSSAVVGLLLLTGCGIPFPPIDRTGEVRQPWVLTGAAERELELAVVMAGSDCDRFARVDVNESEQQIEVEAWVEELRTDACFLVRLYHPATVTLSVPLGSRALIGCMIESSAPHEGRESCAEIVEP